jgi:hypothetical protein
VLEIFRNLSEMKIGLKSFLDSAARRFNACVGGEFRTASKGS